MGSLARSSISSGSVRKPTIRPSISSCLRLIRPMRKWELSMTLWSGCLTRRRFRRCLIRMRRRCFRRKGVSVFFLLNITDVDDKIINKAHDLGEEPLVLAKRLAKSFFKDMTDLHVESINLYANASDHIPEIIDQVAGLLKKGLAYRVEDDVYFDISKFPGYGRLSHHKLEYLTVHRVDPDPRKKHPGDFALWKGQKPGEIFWDSPWGNGRPGWHVEDTAITLTYFGPNYDVHGGGTELIFQQHEAEIAQAEGVTGKKQLESSCHHT